MVGLKADGDAPGVLNIGFNDNGLNMSTFYVFLDASMRKKQQDLVGRQLALPLRCVTVMFLSFNSACVLIAAMLGAVICGCGGRSGAMSTGQ